MEYFFIFRNIYTGEIVETFSASYGMALFTLGLSPLDYDLVSKEPCPEDPDEAPDEDCEPDWDLDMGFDPYCGCYTDDC